MLSDVIRGMVSRQSDMEVVCEVVDPIELLLSVSTTKVDVVIFTPLSSEGESKICSHLLAESPQIKIVTLLAKGEIAFLYESDAPKKRIEEPSEKSILGAIRESLQKTMQIG
jgi:DNA-binding NarL/FixJ family response regulator